MTTQLFTYRYKDKLMCGSVQADSETEMYDILEAMARSAIYDGELQSTQPASDADEQYARDRKRAMN